MLPGEFFAISVDERIAADGEAVVLVMLLSPSFPKRSQMKRIFLPFCPMLPSAKARFMTNGMSTKVDSATARLVLIDRSRNLRREIILKLCIGLLLLEALKGHQH